MNSEKRSCLSDGYVIRDYNAADPEESRKCQHVEERASQMKNALLRKLLVVTNQHLRSFHSRSELFPKSFVLVCEGPGSEICGVVAVGIKKVPVHGRIIEAGYLFDLRVHEAHQRRGIGRALSLACEDRCRQLGAELIYLSVNGDNPRAQQLYKSLGFTTASTRAPAVSFLLGRTPSARVACKVSPVSKTQALEMTQKYYHMRDLTPADTEKLFDSEFYAGSYVAHLAEHASDVCESDPWALVSLWDANNLTTFSVDRIILPFSWLSSPITSAVCNGTAIVLQLYFGQKLYHSYLHQAWLRSLLFSLILVAGTWLFIKARRLLGGIVGLLRSRSPKVRARIFAPVVNEAHPQSGQLLEDLVSVVLDKLASDGFAIAVCNLDEGYKYRKHFPKQRFKTLFMQKSLVPNGCSEGTLPFDPNGFFDPRDIS
eukprot:TRINITY_DN11423_c0_g1_i1.p1 TRINITY_DN11423_c0_g1~~TRINITY_DN11423_c0_g1_i1.p1  ORF type:complete len:428 (+),score=55.76 TRINITY_DN11423_c0_g1_i1:27-1310(+)